MSGELTDRDRKPLPKLGNKAGVWAVVGIVLAALSALISIGAFPKIDTIATKEDTAVLHKRVDAVKAEAKEEYQRIYQTIREQQVETKALRDDTARQLEKIDARTWQIYQEVKRP